MARLGFTARAAAVAATVLAATVLLVVTGHAARLDRALAHPGPQPGSGAAELLVGLALVTWPGLLYAAVGGIAAWAMRRRLRNLAWALWLAILLGWGGNTVLKVLLRRERPDSTLPDLLTSRAWGFPAEHATAVAVLAIALVAATTITRQPRRTVVAARVGGALLIALVVVNRWWLAAHHVSDLVAGLALGSLAATAALQHQRVHVLDEHWRELVGLAPRPGPSPTRARRPAIIWNPAKVGDVTTFRRRLEHELEHHGLVDALWLETTAADPGHSQVARALREDVDLVLVAGGDGTVRLVCSDLAETGVPVGLVPAGTTNLLARNLAIPLDEQAALEVALGGRPGQIDLIRVTPDDDPARAEHFAVIAGIGVDADAFAHTDEGLKDAIGHAAYFVAAAHEVADGSRFRAVVTLDADRPRHYRAAMVSIGNVGYIQGGVEVIPGARPDDGVLNVAVATPRGIGGWARLVGEVLVRADERGDMVELSGRRVRVELSEPRAYQLDGDAAGELRTLEAQVVPGALTVMLPAQ